MSLLLCSQCATTSLEESTINYGEYKFSQIGAKQYFTNVYSRYCPYNAIFIINSLQIDQFSFDNDQLRDAICMKIALAETPSCHSLNHYGLPSKNYSTIWI